MKTFICILVFLGVLSGCVDKNISPVVLRGKLNEEFTLQPHQTILLTRQADGEKVNPAEVITVKILEAVDNTCPKDFQCITAGNVKIDISVAKEGTATQTVYFCSGAGCALNVRTGLPYGSDTAEFRIENEQYAAYLRQVTSLGKKGGRPNEVQRVTILIEEK